jgi:hypothetical protein
MSRLAEKLARLSPEQRALLERKLAQRRQARPPETIEPRPLGSGVFPLSFSQERLWFVDHLEPGNPFYNIFYAVRLDLPLRPRLLARALTEVARRQEALRTVFAERDGEPVQVVEPLSRFRGLPLVDLGALGEEERVAEALRIHRRESLRGFDLARGPICRFRLLRLGADDHVFISVIHHIVSDEQSMFVLLQELRALYLAFSRGAPSPLPPLPIQYRDYAAWQAAWPPEGLERERKYWRGKLAPLPPALDLPTDRPRSRSSSGRGAREGFLLEESLCRRLTELEEGCTLFMAVVAAYQILLHDLSGSSRVLVSAPVSSRDRTETEGLIGFLINTLLFPADLSGDPTVRELLEQARGTVLGAFEHRHLPLQMIVRELAPEREGGFDPLLQIGMNFIEGRLEEEEIAAEFDMRIFGPELETAKFDLNLLLSHGATGMWCRFQYKVDLFDASTITSMLGQLRWIFERMAAAPDARLSELRAGLASHRAEERRRQRARFEQKVRQEGGGPRRRRKRVALVREPEARGEGPQPSNQPSETT